MAHGPAPHGGRLGIVASVAAAAVSLPAGAGGRRLRAWPLTLAIQVLLIYLPFCCVPCTSSARLSPVRRRLVPAPCPGPLAVGRVCGVVASWSALYATVPQTGLTHPPGFVNVLYDRRPLALIGLLVYGLSWLAGAARQLEALRGELTRMAVLPERLRVARDVHDLLGLGLSAIALKADLIAPADRPRRQPGRGRDRGDEPDLRPGPRGHPAGHRRRRALPLAAELAAAQEILASAGVEVRSRSR